MKHRLRTIILGACLMTFPPAQAASDLIAATEAGRTEAVKALIAQGADLEARDAQGRTALLVAVAGNHVGAAKALLAAGANLNAQAANRDTPWLLAGAAGRAEIVAAMLPLKPDLSLRNRYGGSALIPACERAHVETVKLLLTSGIDVNHVNDLGWTCLLEIVILGDGGPRHQQVAKLVLDAGADPNLADRDGATPLAHARARGQGAVARLIEQAGGRVQR
ncbi:ankyrin repeat domain-containing protein [Bosea sp. (in: a-proteobacteria)]|uniref:ankyrin repeat domain-containing protein n=1 Tax=Bosea sp. (in: a-proteobacteria) TaxID=1871050 RepID=UPI00261FDB77|nr:ankyrin repeat domain-containing protein [Bosea sp. (in: a-proteobacteria)]MCO5090297.1 ankyrin repeat domain-containing protein [Bosea sp. (in: a-proteobacteria)]